MRSDAEGENSSLFSENIELIRVRIGRWVAVGGGQNDENRVARLHLLARDDSIFGEEAARVLDGRVVSQDLLNHGLKKAGIGVDLVAYLGARSQSEQRIADQTRRRFIRLREKADSIRDNGVRFIAPDALRLPRKGAQQAVFAAQERAKRLEQMSRRRLALLNLFGTARRRDAAREIVHPQSGLMQHAIGNAEQTRHDINGQVKRNARLTLRSALFQKNPRPLIALLSGPSRVNRRQRRRHRLFKRTMTLAVIHTDEMSKDFGGGRSE